MMKQRVSAILPNFNHANVVGRAIASIIAQTHPVHELIIIDDASTDESLKRIHTAVSAAPGNINIRVLENANNRGVVETLNLGINEATGDFLHLGAADDWYGPEMFERLLEGLLLYPEAALLCGNPVEVDAKTGTQTRRPLPFGDSSRYLDPEALIREARRQNFLFSTGGCLLRREAVMAAGGLRSDLRWHCDWLLNFVIAFRHGAYLTPYDILYMTVGDETYSTGRRDSHMQLDVLANIVRHVVDEYSDVLPAFRRAALLPTYDPALAANMKGESAWLRYSSPRLRWRLAAYNYLRLVGRAFPVSARQKLRRCLGM